MDDRPGEFAEIIREAMPDHVITNFVLVCEVVNEEGTELTVAHSESMTPWLANGMLLSAQDLLQNAMTDEE